MQNTGEHHMVRHEAAEALGAIATPEAMSLLGNYLGDTAPEVQESCVVGTHALCSLLSLLPWELAPQWPQTLIS